jgi:type II secretory pathway pseudopilin PulG
VLSTVARNGRTIEETLIMSKLSQLSARERQRIIDDFVDGVFAGTAPDAPGAGIARGMRQLPADLPDDPSPEQVDAWVELAGLVADEDFQRRARSMALAGASAAQDSAAQDSAAQDSAAQDSAAQDSAAQDSAAKKSAAEGDTARGDAGEPGYQDVIQHAGQAVADGTDPGSPAGRAVLDRIVAPGTSAAERAAMLERLETFADARVERYWQLLAILNDQPAPPSVVPAFEWLIAALRADLDGRPSEARQGQPKDSQGQPEDSQG